MTGLLIEVVRSTRNGSGFYGHIPIEPDYAWKCTYATFGFYPKLGVCTLWERHLAANNTTFDTLIAARCRAHMKPES